MDRPVASERRRHRCAIYSRKSSEEGLEQSFNSLDAQREACVAFIESQRHEGWKALEARYNDGGYSGGSIERPALQALLADIEAGRVDVVVVYKVDRLTRSLADFAKIIERFDAKQVSFVSVTQQFNTTSSMGRLTLNVLLSFAQFEREVTGERIRDKIAASKRKGMWMGGPIPLGYDLKDRKLLINKRESELVQRIYTRYLALGCVRKLQAELKINGVKSKVRVSRAGRRSGGVLSSRGALYQILRNRLYRGEIAHRGAVHPGEHKAILSKELWEKVQARLAVNGRARRLGLNAKAPSLLAGLLFDAAGNRYTPKHSSKNGKRYRYYTSQAVIRNGPTGKTSASHIPAHGIEELVVKRLQALMKDPREFADVAAVTDSPIDAQRAILRAAKERSKSWSILPPSEMREFLYGVISRITVTEDAIEIGISRRGLRATLLGEQSSSSRSGPVSSTSRASEDIATLRVEAKLIRIRGESQIISPIDAHDTATGRPDAAILKAIARGRLWYEMLISGEAASIHALTKSTGVHVSYVSRILRLSFLAPDIVARLIEGQQPRGLTLDKLMRNVPLHWDQQRVTLMQGGLRP